MQETGHKTGADAGARLAIRLLQDAAQRGELDPWDVDLIPVIDGFLDQLRQRIEVPRRISEHLGGRGGTYERELAESPKYASYPDFLILKLLFFLQSLISFSSSP